MRLIKSEKRNDVIKAIQLIGEHTRISKESLIASKNNILNRNNLRENGKATIKNLEKKCEEKQWKLQMTH